MTTNLPKFKECTARVYIDEKGEATVELVNTMFRQEPGATIPLKRKDCNILIEEFSEERGSLIFRNGHSII